MEIRSTQEAVSFASWSRSSPQEVTQVSTTADGLNGNAVIRRDPVAALNAIAVLVLANLVHWHFRNQVTIQLRVCAIQHTDLVD
jgi:hypothetical protein